MTVHMLASRSAEAVRGPRTDVAPRTPAGSRAWALKGRCVGRNPDELFVSGAAQREAAKVCGACPVKLECLADALDNHIEFGVWGGLTERQRRAILRQRPDVASWRELFETARDEATRADAG
jgi:WhiB family transcriptional regulator, redox-sensing transcriptional regulator